MTLFRNRKALGLLRMLQDRGKYILADMARDLRMTRTHLVRILPKLEQACIRGYHAEVIPEKVGLHYQAFVRVRISAPKVASAINSFEEWAEANPYVVECYRLAGSFDYIMRVLLPSVTDYEDFAVHASSVVPGIMSMETMWALHEVTRKRVPLRHAVLTPNELENGRWWQAQDVDLDFEGLHDD